MSNYKNNLRKAREDRKIKSSEVLEKLKISKAVLSSWETGKHQPDIEMLIQLADFYNTTIDYLVGRTIQINPITIQEQKTGKIPYESFRLLHGDAAYSMTYGWFLVNTITDCALFADGSTIPLKNIKDSFMYSRGSTIDSGRYSVPLLTIEEIKNSNYIWVEPICMKDSPLKQLAGAYTVYADLGFVENEQGNRFMLSTYKNLWTAFHASSLDDKECEDFLDLYHEAYDDGYEDGEYAGREQMRREYEDPEEVW